MRLIVIVVAGFLALAGCAKNEPVAESPKKSTDEPLKQYAIKGEVKQIGRAHV